MTWEQWAAKKNWHLHRNAPTRKMHDYVGHAECWKCQDTTRRWVEALGFEYVEEEGKK